MRLTVLLPPGDSVDWRTAGLHDVRMEPAADQIQNDPGERPSARTGHELRYAVDLMGKPTAACMYTSTDACAASRHQVFMHAMVGHHHRDTSLTALARGRHVVSLGDELSVNN